MMYGKRTAGLFAVSVLYALVVLGVTGVARSAKFSPPVGWISVPNSVPFASEVRTWHKGRQVLQLTIDKSQTTLDPYPSDVLNTLKSGPRIGKVVIQSVRRDTTCGKRPVWLVSFNDIGPNHPYDSDKVVILYGNWRGRGYDLAYTHPYAEEDVPAAVASLKHVCI